MTVNVVNDRVVSIDLSDDFPMFGKGQWFTHPPTVIVTDSSGLGKGCTVIVILEQSGWGRSYMSDDTGALILLLQVNLSVRNVMTRVFLSQMSLSSCKVKTYTVTSDRTRSQIAGMFDTCVLQNRHFVIELHMLQKPQSYDRK